MVTTGPTTDLPPRDAPISRSSPPPTWGFARLHPSDWSVPVTASPILLSCGAFASSVSLLARVDAHEWQATIRRVLLTRTREAEGLQDSPVALVVLGRPPDDYPLHVPVLFRATEGAPESCHFVPAQIWQSGRRPVRFLRDGVWHAPNNSRSGIATRCPPEPATLIADPRTPEWVPVRVDVVSSDAVSPPRSRRRVEVVPTWNPHGLQAHRGSNRSPPTLG